MVWEELFLNGNQVENAGKKKIVYIVIAVLCAALVAAVVFFAVDSFGSDKKAVMEYRNDKGKVTGEIDMNLMSLVMSVVNSQLGADAYVGTGLWDMEYQEGSGKTVKDVVEAQAKAYAEGLLQAEYLHDHVYSLELSKDYVTFLDSYIDELTVSFGGKKQLEDYLSTYGTDSESLKRYMILVMKSDALRTAFYSEGGLRYSQIEPIKKAYFEANYRIADHILLKYSGGVKDDGTEIPLTEEEKQQKKEKARVLFDEIQNGVRQFDDALIELGEDTYILGYPYGYFVADNYNLSGLSEDVQNAVREMEVGEIRLVEAENGSYIIRRNPMNAEMYKSNGDFNAYIESAVIQEDFLSQCEGASSLVVYDELLESLDPENIPSFNMNLLGQE